MSSQVRRICRLSSVSTPVHTVMRLRGGMELADRITGRVAELTGEVELLRKQFASTPGTSWNGWL